MWELSGRHWVYIPIGSIPPLPYAGQWRVHPIMFFQQFVPDLVVYAWDEAQQGVVRTFHHHSEVM